MSSSNDASDPVSDVLGDASIMADDTTAEPLRATRGEQPAKEAEPPEEKTYVSQMDDEAEPVDPA